MPGPIAERLPDRVAPGPRGLPGLGVLPALGRQDMIDYYVSAWRQYGDVVRFPLGPMVSHLVIWPDDVRHVLADNQQNYIKGVGLQRVRLALGQGLFTVDGPLWRRQRRLMQPPFTPTGVTQFAPAMSHAAEALVNGWYAHVLRGEPVDVNAEMMRLAMSIIAPTMLSVDIGEQAIEASRAFTFVLQYVSRRSANLIDVPLSVPTPGNRRFRAALASLDAFVYGLIEERQRQGAEGNDLLTMLLNARDQETGEGMPLRQIRDEVLTIFFAGHETTAQALTWVWFNLALNPEVEARLHREIETVLGGRAPTVEDLPKLDYVRAVVDETMRLFPPVWVFVRQAVGADRIGGYDVPAGSMVLLSQYITHRHPGPVARP